MTLLSSILAAVNSFMVDREAPRLYSRGASRSGRRKGRLVSDETGFADYGGVKGNCPVADRFFYKQQFNLPMYPRLTLQELEDTVYGIRETAKKLAKK